jgi:hypothetical protein
VESTGRRPEVLILEYSGLDTVFLAAVDLAAAV